MAEERVQRRLAAILAADVVGFSRLMGANEAGTLAALKAHRRELVDGAIAEHQGRIVKLTGDGMLVEFASVVNAVSCAVAIQREMPIRNADVPTRERIEFRIGVNVGDVIIEDGDIYGDGVNIAVRIEGLAEPNGVCVSRAVCDQVLDKLDLVFEDMGELELKNIARPVHVFRLAAFAGDQPNRGPQASASPSPAPPDRPSIAVLPFANMSADPSQQYFCDGITEDILTELQRFRNLLVIARNSSFQFRDGATDIKAIARELGVRYIVEGSVRSTPERVRITAQLIDAETAAHLWANRYDRTMADLFAIQDEISRSIATTLWSAIDVAEDDRAKHKRPSQMQAYDYILRARNVWFKWTREANREAQRLIEKALELDPRYATAWSWLAWVHIGDWRASWCDDRAKTFALAMEAVRTAIALDPHDYFSHWPLAYLLVRSRRYEEGLAEYERTIALNPNDSRLLDEMSAALCLLGRPEDAIVQQTLAMRLDPLHPEWFHGTLGLAYYLMRDYDKAVAATAHLGGSPGGAYLSIRAAACAQLGHDSEAHMAAREHIRLQPDWLAALKVQYPFKDPADLEHLLDGLRKAGLPQ
jgi:adenylate cyclase